MSKKVCILGEIPFLEDWLQNFEKVEEKDADVIFVDLWYNGNISPNVILVSGESFLNDIPYQLSIGPKSSSKDILFPYFLQNFYNRIPEFSQRKLTCPKEFCCFIVSNDIYPMCILRTTFCLYLSHFYKKVHSWGKILNNMGCIPVKNWHSTEHIEFMSNYKFCICFENNDVPMYHTEKIGNAYLAGCIPIYWGSKTAVQFFNPKAFLFLEDNSEEGCIRLIEKIKEIDTNEELYQKMRNELLFDEENMNSFVEQVKTRVLNL